MEWFPVVFFIFKALALGTGMFFAIKWHYDRGNKKQDKAKTKREILHATGKMVAVLVLLLLSVGFVTYFLLSHLSLDLTLP